MNNNYKIDYYNGKYFEESYGIDYQVYQDKKFREKKKWFWGWIKLVNKHLNLNTYKNSRVLEIGCAEGSFISCLNDMGILAEGAEMNQKILNIAKRYNPDNIFFLLDIEKQLASEKYDIIFAFEVLEHIKNSHLALKNIYDSLNKEGILIFSSAYPFPKHLSDPYHISVKNLEEWSELARFIGFDVIYKRVVSFLPLFYKISKKFSIALPLKIKNKYFVTTNFLIVSKQPSI